MGGGLLVVASRRPMAGAQESGRGGQGAAAERPRLLAAHRSRRSRDGVHGQGRDRPEHSHVAGADRRRRTPRADGAISLVMADTDLTPFDQGTFGSQTTPTMAPVLARAAATARELLIDRRGRQWQVGRATRSRRTPAASAPPTAERWLWRAHRLRGDLKGVVAASTAVAPKARWTTRGTRGEEGQRRGHRDAAATPSRRISCGRACCTGA